MSRIKILTSGTSFTVPSDFNTADNTVIVIGGGGGGARAAAGGNAGMGGGGGAVSLNTNMALTPGATVYYNIGSGGPGATATNTAGTSGGDTWLNWNGSSSSNTAPTSDATGLLAKGGNAGTVATNASAAGGASGSGYGTTKYSGGASGTVPSTATDRGGTGGGSSATASVNGYAGGQSTASAAGGGGGGGTGGAGGNTATATAGTAGAASTGGGGGAGGSGSTISGANQPGAVGNAGTHYTLVDGTQVGFGGGGGGGGGNSNTTSGAALNKGGNGGNYGGGGGGGGGASTTGNGGNGAGGAVILIWTPPIEASYIGSATSSSSTSSIQLTGVTASVGNMVVVAVSADNAGTSGASAIASGACSDSAGNTWVNRDLTNYTSGVTNDGVTLAIWTSTLTSALSSGSITIAFSPNVTNKTVHAYKVVGNGSYRPIFSTIGSANTETAFGDQGTFDADALSLPARNILFGFQARDNGYGTNAEGTGYSVPVDTNSSRVSLYSRYKPTEAATTETFGNYGNADETWQAITNALVIDVSTLGFPFSSPVMSIQHILVR